MTCPHKLLRKQLSGTQVWYVCESWIPVEKRFPELKPKEVCKVRVWDSEWKTSYDAYYNGKENGIPQWLPVTERAEPIGITHWMPLPDPPGECGQKFKAQEWDGRVRVVAAQTDGGKE